MVAGYPGVSGVVGEKDGLRFNYSYKEHRLPVIIQRIAYDRLIKLSEPVFEVKLGPGRKVPRLPYTGLQFDSLRITMDSKEWDVRVLLQTVIAPSFKEALNRELKNIISDAVDLLCK